MKKLFTNFNIFRVLFEACVTLFLMYVLSTPLDFLVFFYGVFLIFSIIMTFNKDFSNQVKRLHNIVSPFEHGLYYVFDTIVFIYAIGFGHWVITSLLILLSAITAIVESKNYK